MIAQAEAEALQIHKSIESEAVLDRIDALAANHPELAERPRQRLLLREVEGQLNIEAVAHQAQLALPVSVSDEPVSSGWRRKFFAEAENVCEADLQFLWGRVLAGEIAQPGSFSLRTLDALKHLSRHEAELFRKACTMAMHDGWIALDGPYAGLSMKATGLSYGDVLSLRDAGLVMDGDHIHRGFTASTSGKGPSIARTTTTLLNNGVLIQLSSAGAIRLPMLPFTAAGRELQRLNEFAPCEEYFRSLGTFLRGRKYQAKRGTLLDQGNGQTVITFDEDL